VLPRFDVSRFETPIVKQSFIYYTPDSLSLSNNTLKETTTFKLNIKDKVMSSLTVFLSALEPNTQVRIIAMSGPEQRIQILRRMGIVEGARITLLEKSEGNLLIKNVDSRIIMSHRLAQYIQVELI
jgi:Fe2+ transport system protein FeoA